MLDRRFTAALHVEALRRTEALADHEPHVLFQASTIGALIEGRYDGDVTLAEVAEHGDLGLGTLNGLDGELIVLDGAFLRADVEGDVAPVPPDSLTPFAVVAPFAPTLEIEVGPVDHAGLIAAVESALPADVSTCALRIEGDWERIAARSVPRQHPPYRPLGEVVADQRVFELCEVAGTMVGFRFPDHGEGVEVPGFHLHFVSADLRRGGHILDSAAQRVTVAIDLQSDLHVELPAGVELEAAHLDASYEEVVRRVERGG